MFFAVGSLARAPVELTIGFAFERQFRMFAVNRRGLTFDSRFAPPIAGASAGVILYFLLDGTLTLDGARTFRGPTMLAMRESHFEGEHGQRTCWISSSGTPFTVLELRILASDCALPSSLDEGPVEVPLATEADSLVSAARLYVHASLSRSGRERTLDLASAYLQHLHQRGYLRRDLAATIVRDEGAAELVWSALRPAVERFGATLSQGGVAATLGWKTQRLQREIAKIADRLGIAWLGRWRDVAHRYRVRVATLLLSSPALSVTEVASLAGYASVEALAHALEDFGLPTASELRRETADGRSPR